MPTLRDNVMNAFKVKLPAKRPGFEARQPQLDITLSIADAFAAGSHCLVEAGTGTGKSYGYLVPAMEYLRDHPTQRVFITTFAKVLQDQISQKDVPLLNNCLDLDLTSVVIKGKSNYLCLKRFKAQQAYLATLDNHAAETKGLSTINSWAQWIESTETGDKAELEDHPMWQGVTIDDDCEGKDCPLYKECFYYKMRTRAENADIIIGNHTLMCLDLVVRRNSDDKATIVPNYDFLVVDEAHHLEDVASDAFSAQITDTRIRRICNSITSQMSFIDQGRLAEYNAAFFDWFWQRRPKPKYEGGREETTWTLRETPIDLVENLTSQLGKVAYAVKKYADNETPEGRLAQRLYNRMSMALNDLYWIVRLDDTESAHWAELTNSGDGVTLKATPLNINRYLRETLFDKTPTILTSATISVNKRFEYLKSSLGIDDPIEKVVGSPFDYEHNCIFYVPQNIPDPVPSSQMQGSAYAKFFIDEAKRVIETAEGGVLFLFTSWSSMNVVYDALFDKNNMFTKLNARRVHPAASAQYDNRATGERYLVFKQGEGSIQQIIDGFKAAGNGILFGVASFWEGLDVPGSALRCVVIEKFPFEVPTHPVIQARLEALGNQSFTKFTVPRAVVKFKQGFGRLIRTKDDRGAVVLMDGRSLSKGYGSIFLNSLPNTLKTRNFNIVEQFFNGSLVGGNK